VFADALRHVMMECGGRELTSGAVEVMVTLHIQHNKQPVCSSAP
jgi:hypothetical protein